MNFIYDCLGASPSLRDSGRGLKAEQWARFCGRYVCAEVIEKFTKQKFSDKSISLGKWGSEPELDEKVKNYVNKNFFFFFKILKVKI